MNTLLPHYGEAEKTAYLSTIAALASADRSASPPENEFLTALAASAQLSPQATAHVLAAAQDSTNESIRLHLDTLKGSELRYSLVADIISFAKADESYSADEEQMMEQMAAYLGVNSAQVQALGQVVAQTQQQPAVQSAEQANSLFGSTGLGDTLRKVGIEPSTLAQGMIGILAPLLIAKVLGRNQNGGVMSGMGGGMGGGIDREMGGGLLGALGGLLGGGASAGAGGGLGGLLGGVMSGGAPSGGAGGGLGGGLGSLMGVLGGLGGQRYGGLANGGLGAVLGGLLGR